MTNRLYFFDIDKHPINDLRVRISGTSESPLDLFTNPDGSIFLSTPDDKAPRYDVTLIDSSEKEIDRFTLDAQKFPERYVVQNLEYNGYTAFTDQIANRSLINRGTVKLVIQRMSEFKEFRRFQTTLQSLLTTFDNLTTHTVGVLSGDPRATTLFASILENIFSEPSDSQLAKIPAAQKILSKIMDTPKDNQHNIGRSLLHHESAVGLIIATFQMSLDLARNTFLYPVIKLISNVASLEPFVQKVIETQKNKTELLQHLNIFRHMFNSTFAPHPDDIRKFEFDSEHFRRFRFEIPDLDDWDTIFPELGCSRDYYSYCISLDCAPYEIAGLEPNDGCPGDLLWITGSHFGEDRFVDGYPGPVIFQRRSSPLTIEVEPNYWTDERIRVDIPPEVGCGPVSIQILEGTHSVCRTLLPVYRPAGPTQINYFESHLTDVQYFELNGAVLVRDETYMAEPGTDINFAWSLCGSAFTKYPDLVTVSFRLIIPDVPLTVIDWRPVNPTDSVDYTIPSTVSIKRELVAELRVENNQCVGPTDPPLVDVFTRSLTIDVRATISLTGIEISQSTQFLRAAEHMIDSAGTGVTGIGADNSVFMIAKKDTLVRVYFSTNAFPTFRVEIPDINIQLSAWKWTKPLARPTAELRNTDLTAEEDDSVISQRSRLTRSANFILPFEWTVHDDELLQITATLSLNEEQERFYSVGTERLYIRDVEFLEPKQPIRFAIVPISLNGFAEPELLDIYKVVMTIARMFPCNDRQFASFEMPRGLNHDLTRPDNDGLEDLVREFDDIVDNEMPWPWVFCGVYSNAVPVVGSVAIMVTGSNVTVFPDGATFSAAHETGHVFGLEHSSDDANRPNYGTPNSFNIGEYGIDVADILEYDPVADDIVFNPLSAQDALFDRNLPDIMGPRSNKKWVSPYDYQKLWNDHFRTELTFVLTGSGIFESVMADRLPKVDGLRVKGTIDVDAQEVKIRPIFRGEYYCRGERQKESDYVIIISSDDDRILKRQNIDLSSPSCGTLQKKRFKEIVIYHEAIAKIEIMHKNKILFAQKITHQPLEIDVFEHNVDKSGEQLILRWTCPEDWFKQVLFTNNHGLSWKYFEVQTANEMTIPLNLLPGGHNCRFRLQVTDGTGFGLIDTSEFELDHREPILILNRGENVNVKENQYLELSVDVIQHEFSDIRPDQISWHVDNELQGKGKNLSLIFDREGTHQGKVILDYHQKCTSVKEFTIEVVKNDAS